MQSRANGQPPSAMRGAGFVSAVRSLPVPLRADPEGVLRISGTRVTLDTVVASFDRGATPEEIATQYPSLQLPEVYAVIAYYLTHRTELEAYLSRRREQAALVRAENERRFPPHGIRERLLARRRP